jgi:hypothetical protein
MPATRDRLEEIRELEELWAAPAATERPLPAGPRRLNLSLPWIHGWYLAAGWLGFFAMVLVAEPAPSPDMHTPLWADLLVGANLVALFGAALLGPLFGRVGFGAAGVAGGVGIAIAIACTATGHHAGNWWLAELGVTAALTGLAAAGFAQRLRGQ